MDKEFTDKLKEHLLTHKPKYHLVVMSPLGNSSRYGAESHNLDYITEIADEVLGKDYTLNAQCMFMCLADSLRVMPSGLVVPQGHADENIISNLEGMYGGPLPNIPIFHAMKHTGIYCHKNGSLISFDTKIAKDELVKTEYRNWLLTDVKPNVLDLSKLI